MARDSLIFKSLSELRVFCQGGIENQLQKGADLNMTINQGVTRHGKWENPIIANNNNKLELFCPICYNNGRLEQTQPNRKRGDISVNFICVVLQRLTINSNSLNSQIN
jgi:hypothetical protein